MIDRHVLGPDRRTRRQGQPAVSQGHVGVGRDQVDVVHLDLHPFGHFPDAEGAILGQDFGQVALVVRLQVDHK